MQTGLRARRGRRQSAWLWCCALGVSLALGVVPAAIGAGSKAAVHHATKGRVARAFFTTDVIDREPVDRVLVLSNVKDQIYFFTDLRHMQGQTIIHRWMYKGKVVASVPFHVKGPRWRVYSSKQLDPNDLGKWTVIVTDSHGWPLKAGIFRYVAAGGTGDNAPVILPPDADDQEDQKDQ